MSLISNIKLDIQILICSYVEILRTTNIRNMSTNINEKENNKQHNLLDDAHQLTNINSIYITYSTMCTECIKMYNLVACNPFIFRNGHSVIYSFKLNDTLTHSIKRRQIKVKQESLLILSFVLILWSNLLAIAALF